MSTSVEVKKTQEATVATVDEKASSNGDEEPVFPPPKYIVTIVSPRTLLLHDNVASLDEWKEFEQSTSAEAAATSVLNLHVLLVSLLNRLLLARLFPRRAVHSFLTPAAGTDDHEWVVFSILTPAKVLPILLSKCEHFGVGNLVGLVYACPIETCVLPLLRHSIDEEEEEQGLLTVPSMFAQRAPLASANSVVGTVISTFTNAPLAPMAYSSSVLVMAPTHQKKASLVPDPAPIRPVRSETIPDADADTTEQLDDIRTNGLQRRHSHQDVLQSAQVDEKKEETKKETKTPLLEEIPEAKSSKAATTIELENKEAGRPDGDFRKADSVRPSKSILIGKVLEARKEWLATASRIRVEQVAEEVTAAAALTWDYMLFVACAAAIAATGLATDSSVTVLASMLVSPIMGPVLAVTFGTMIRRRSMIQKALRNEAISLLMCVFVGACGALVVWWTRLYESSDWPSDEMLARGNTSGLASGVLIALPSGMATALSTLARNSSGLVGVAISLSLLPPAVNAGLCWMFALLDSTRLVDKEPDDNTNYWKIGSTSFGLTLLNILCIWLAGVFTFWLKEVAPVERKSAFWSRDLKIARQPPKEVGSGKIKEGLQAAIDLKKNFGTESSEEDLTVKTGHDLRTRRMSTPTTRWENALMLDRTRDGAIPHKPIGIDRASSEGILERAEALGGMDKASEVLFSNNIFSVDGESMFGSSANQNPEYQDVINFSYHPENPETVPPRDVYEEFLWQRYRNPKM